MPWLKNKGGLKIQLKTLMILMTTEFTLSISLIQLNHETLSDSRQHHFNKLIISKEQRP